MIFYKAICALMFLSLSHEFHLRNYSRRTFTRRITDLPVTQGHPDMRGSFTFPVGGRSRYTPYRARYPMHVPVQVIRQRNNMYERRRNDNTASPKGDLINGGRRQLPRRVEPLSPVRVPKKSLLVSDNKAQPVSALRNPKLSAVVPETNLQRLSTYSGRASTLSARGGAANKDSSKPQHVVKKINIVFPKLERQPMNQGHETRVLQDLDVIKPLPDLTTTSEKLFTNLVFQDKAKTVNINQPNKNVIAKDNQQTNGSGIKSTALMPVEVNNPLKLRQVREKLQEILLITDENVRREAMKTLVKSIVAESDILSKTGTTNDNVDISTFESILGLINEISAKLKTNSRGMTTLDLSTTKVIPIPTKPDLTDIAGLSKSNFLQKEPKKNTSQRMNSDKGQLVLPGSTKSLEHLTGMSIFGDVGRSPTKARKIQEGQGMVKRNFIFKIFLTLIIFSITFYCPLFCIMFAFFRLGPYLN